METSFKILLGTDYSEAVMNAERYAVQFAKKTSSSLEILHVFDAPLSPALVPHDEENVELNSFEIEQERLQNHTAELLTTLKISPQDLNYNCAIRQGSTGMQICQEAKEEQVDFITVGTHGVNGFKEFFIGSHTWDVIKMSEVPVLVVPEDGRFTDIRTIVYSTEYHQEEIPIINFISKLAERFGADLTIVHVTNYSLSKEFEGELFERFAQEVRDTVTYSRMQIRMAYYEDLVKGLHDFCLKEKADWLAMPTGKSTLMEKIFTPFTNMTRRMVFHTHIPILVIPDFFFSKKQASMEMEEEEDLSEYSGREFEGVSFI